MQALDARLAGAAAARRRRFAERMAAFPRGAAVKSEEEMAAALRERCEVVFVLRGNGLELAGTIRDVHEAGKLAAIHLDLVDGLASDFSGVRWLVRCGADAIISSHGSAVRAIRAEEVVAIQRLLCTGRSALESGLAAVARAEPDFVELLPGVILPEVSDLVLPRLAVPLLAGGFIRSREDVERVLGAGALAITTSERTLWS